MCTCLLHPSCTLQLWSISKVTCHLTLNPLWDQLRKQKFIEADYQSPTIHKGWNWDCLCWNWDYVLESKLSFIWIISELHKCQRIIKFFIHLKKIINTIEPFCFLIPLSEVWQVLLYPWHLTRISIAVIKIIAQSNLGRKGFKEVHSIVLYWGKSGHEIK